MRRFRIYACSQTVGLSYCCYRLTSCTCSEECFAFGLCACSVMTPILGDCLSSAQTTILCDGQELLYIYAIHILCNLRSGASVETRLARLQWRARVEKKKGGSRRCKMETGSRGLCRGIKIVSLTLSCPRMSFDTACAAN